MKDGQFEHPDVILCPDGPMLLRGRHVVQDSAGDVHATERPVTALCRCDKSATHPWCDGTHKAIPEKLRPV
jgi:CDGSH-type Zn-finger protein